MHQLITKDPVSGGELIVTRLECPDSGIVIEGQFSLGWIGRLSREQLDFVEMLVKYRGNIQKLAAEMDVAYNTARSRLDEIVAALGGTPGNDGLGRGARPLVGGPPGGEARLARGVERVLEGWIVCN